MKIRVGTETKTMNMEFSIEEFFTEESCDALKLKATETFGGIKDPKEIISADLILSEKTTITFIHDSQNRVLHSLFDCKGENLPQLYRTAMLLAGFKCSELVTELDVFQVHFLDEAIRFMSKWANAKMTGSMRYEFENGDWMNWEGEVFSCLINDVSVQQMIIL